MGGGGGGAGRLYSVRTRERERERQRDRQTDSAAETDTRGSRVKSTARPPTAGPSVPDAQSVTATGNPN